MAKRNAGRSRTAAALVPDDWQRVPVGVYQTDVVRLAKAGLAEYEYRDEVLTGRVRHAFMWWRKPQRKVSA